MFHTIIRGTGSYQPENRVPNDALSQFVDTNDEWIRTRSGIEERRFASARRDQCVYGGQGCQECD